MGVDVVRVQDVADMLRRFGNQYTNRVFTADERRYCVAGGRTAPVRFAARFAAKEAVVKALRPRAPLGDWRTIEVRRHRAGWCDVVLRGEAAELAARQHVRSLSLSMSHGAGHASAVALAVTSRRHA